jgi:cytochrome P450
MDGAGVTLEDLHSRHHSTVAALRADHPVAWVPAIDGWMVTSRDLAVAVMRDAVTYTVDDPRFSTAQVVGPSMLSLDGVEHQRHRTPFADPLRPAEATAAYGAGIDAIARSLVGSLAPRGHAELRRELAGPLAVATSAMVLGLDGMRAADLLHDYDHIVAAVDGVSRGRPVSEEGATAFARLDRSLRAAMPDGATLVGRAACALTAEETVSNAAVFLFGGIETSEGMTANVFHHLLAAPENWARVAEDRSLIDQAVEESLRLEPAAARVDRYATVAVVLEGAHIAKGDLVVVSIAGANRDPAVFADPDVFDLDRPNSRAHVAFARGPHACIGAQLARLQTRSAVHAALDLLPSLALQGAGDATGVIFRKPKTLDATWRVG